MSLKLLRNLFILLSIIILSFGIGLRVGQRNESKQSIIPIENITGKESVKPISVDFALFWDVWERLLRHYIDKKALDAQKMLYGAISGMVSSLDDPYTVFLPPDQNKEAKDDLGGKFEGIGAQLGIKDKKIVVVAPLKESPAEKMGLKPEDWIIKVDGQETAGWTLPQVVSKIRGPKGSSVVLTILHKDASKSADITVVRDEIKVASVEWEVKNVSCQLSVVSCQIIKEECSDCEKVVYLKLGRFGNQTNDEWNKAVDQIVKAIKQSSPSTPLRVNDRAIKGLVFDLRNNPGGYLSGSVFIASEFLESGPLVIQENASGNKQTFNVDRAGRLTKIPMIVLINKGSASASEIVAGALQSRGRAKIVGVTSFGKGSIQEAQDLPGGAGIHITTAKWLLPDGKWINGNGIDPNIQVENDENKQDEDLQLLKAIETLIK